jgi:hypothetical protein
MTTKSNRKRIFSWFLRGWGADRTQPDGRERATGRFGCAAGR